MFCWTLLPLLHRHGPKEINTRPSLGRKYQRRHILFLIILLHSVCSPFQKRQHNNLNMFLLVNILLVNFGAVLEYFLYIRVPGLNDDHIVFTIIITIQVILITIPLVYIIAYASARFMLGKRVRGSSSDYSSFPDRLNQNDNNYGSIQWISWQCVIYYYYYSFV